MYGVICGIKNMKIKYTIVFIDICFFALNLMAYRIFNGIGWLFFSIYWAISGLSDLLADDEFYNNL